MLSPEALPDSAKPVADAALAWLNTQSGRTYSLTGVFGVEDLAELQSGSSVELGLVVCDGELCAREQVEVQQVDGNYAFSLGDMAEREIPPLLDPPPGVRASWLDNVLAKHEFVLLLFYRGLW